MKDSVDAAVLARAYEQVGTLNYYMNSGVDEAKAELEASEEFQTKYNDIK